MSRSGRWMIPLAALFPTAAAAHAFQTGGGFHDQFVEGVRATLAEPAVILCLLPLGVLAGTWRREGMLAIWPWLLCGQVAGLFAGAVPEAGFGIAALGLGALTATLAALRPDPPVPAPQVLAALTGFLASAAGFEGHGLFALPFGIQAGLFLGVLVLPAIPAGLAAATLERWPRPWLRIGWRVAASWLAAIALLVLAFELRPPVA